MTCEQCTADLSRWLDGELTTEQAEAMRQHVEACPECAALYEALREVLDEAASAGDGLPVPENVSKAWRAAVYADAAAAAEKKPLFTGARWPRFAALAAGLVLVVGLSAAMFGDGLLSLQENASTVQSESLDSALSRKTTANEAPLMAFSASEAPMMDYAMEAEAPRMAEEATEREWAAEEAETYAGAADYEDGGEAAPAAGVMLEKRAWYTLSTQSFDLDAAQLKALAEQTGGWIESESQSGKSFDQNGSGRQLSVLLRIPADRMEEVLENLSAIGVLEYSNVYAEDISERYYDTAGRLDNAKALQTQLQALLAQAEDVEVLVEITQKLSENQLQIDSLSGSLRGMESRVAYSRIDVTLNETHTPTLVSPQTPSMGARIRDGLIASLNGMLSFCAGLVVWLIAALPWISLLVLIVLLALWLWRRIRRSR